MGGNEDTECVIFYGCGSRNPGRAGAGHFLNCMDQQQEKWLDEPGSQDDLQHKVYV
jgi:hypothetical protein